MGRHWPSKKHLWRLTGSGEQHYRVVVGRDGEKHIVHRAVWEHCHGPIPKGYIIHHRNGDTTDHRIENLECMTPREHVYLHHEQSEKGVVVEDSP